MTIERRIMGGLFGFAIGDAMGGTTEFMTPAEIKSVYGKVTEIVGGGVWDLEPGETTDDTAMTIAVAKGILANPNDPIESIGASFLEWYESRPKDIGITIRTTFSLYQGDWEFAAKMAHERLDNRSGGNGSLMRCLPIALAYPDPKTVDLFSKRQSKMTHYDELASEACVLYNRIVLRLMEGQSLNESINEHIIGTRYEKSLTKIPTEEPTGFVVDTFLWVLYLVLNGSTFEEIVQSAANLGGDSDTVGAIAGGLAGVFYGFDQLPERYVNTLLCKAELLLLANKLAKLRKTWSPSLPQS